jgi:hypothetical protein
MSGAAWERLRAALEQAVFSQRLLLWDRLQEHVSRRTAHADGRDDDTLIAWPDVLLFVVDSDVDAVLGAAR